MGTLLATLVAALFIAMAVFVMCEEKSLKNSDLSDLKLLITDEVNVSEVFERYNTLYYLSIYAACVFFMGIVTAYFVFIPKGFGLSEAMAYVFFPSLFGSLAILIVKWRFQPLIKLVSSFFYGSIYMGASAFAMAIVYLLKG